jgi:hypothetical protein
VHQEYTKDEILREVRHFPDDTLHQLEGDCAGVRKQPMERWNEDGGSVLARKCIRGKPGNQASPGDGRQPILYARPEMHYSTW